jgi:hypothetical protein
VFYELVDAEVIEALSLVGTHDDYPGDEAMRALLDERH